MRTPGILFGGAASGIIQHSAQIGGGQAMDLALHEIHPLAAILESEG